MSKAHGVPVKVAKTPQQRRSTATVDAIVQATVQVLRKEGKAKLTTTRIAKRAGVSVGTLYQYFPHKTALLQEALRRHLNLLATAMEAACAVAHGRPTAEVADAISDAWITTKLRHMDASIALYSVVEDIEGRGIAMELRGRFMTSMETAFSSASDGNIAHPEFVVATLLGALSGASREMLDPLATEGARSRMAQELRTLVRAYVLRSAGLTPGGGSAYRETPSSGELAVA